MTHTEAPASVNFRAYTKTGWQLQITLRDDSESNLLERMGNTIAAITERGMTPNSNNGSSTTSATQQPAQLQPATIAPVLHNGFADFSFNAEILRVSVDGGKKRFKVLGEQFSQYGIVIYDEILKAAGYEPDNLEPKDYALENVMAIVTHDNKQRKKVAELRANAQ